MYINAPSERGNTYPIFRVLVDGDDLFVRQDFKVGF